MSSLAAKMDKANQLKQQQLQNLRPFGRLIATTPLFTETSNDEKINGILDKCDPIYAAELIESIMLAAYVAGTNRETFVYMNDTKSGVGETIRKRTLEAHAVVINYFDSFGCSDWSYASIIRCVGRTAWISALETLSNTKAGSLIQNLPIFWIVLTEDDFKMMVKSYAAILKLPPVWGYLRSIDAWENRVECGRWRYITEMLSQIPQDQTAAVAYRKIIRMKLRGETVTSDTENLCKARYDKIIDSRSSYGKNSDKVWVTGIKFNTV